MHISKNAFPRCDSLDTVYFYGNSDEFDAMDINFEGNDILFSVNVYFYSQDPPTGDGNYWHYDTDGKTPVLW